MQQHNFLHHWQQSLTKAQTTFFSPRVSTCSYNALSDGSGAAEEGMFSCRPC
jgi:hypothetical protein